MQPRRRLQPRRQPAPRGRPPPRPAARRACTGARRWRLRQSGRARCASWSPSWLPTHRCSTSTPPSGARRGPSARCSFGGAGSVGLGSSCARRLMQPPAAEHEGAGAEGRWRGGPRGHPAGHAHMHCAALSSDGRHSHWTHSSAGVRVPVEEGLHRVPAARCHVWRPGLGGAGGGPR